MLALLNKIVYGDFLICFALRYVSYLWPSFKTEMYYGNFHHTSGVTHTRNRLSRLCAQLQSATKTCDGLHFSGCWCCGDLYIRLFFSVCANVCSSHKYSRSRLKLSLKASSKLVDAAVAAFAKTMRLFWHSNELNRQEQFFIIMF